MTSSFCPQLPEHEVSVTSYIYTMYVGDRAHVI